MKQKSAGPQKKGAKGSRPVGQLNRVAQYRSHCGFRVRTWKRLVNLRRARASAPDSAGKTQSCPCPIPCFRRSNKEIWFRSWLKSRGNSRIAHRLCLVSGPAPSSEFTSSAAVDWFESRDKPVVEQRSDTANRHRTETIPSFDTGRGAKVPRLAGTFSISKYLSHQEPCLTTGLPDRAPTPGS